MAVDGQGSEVVKPFVNDTSFPTVVDTDNQLINLFQFKIIPNGIFLDEEGKVRMFKEGFQVDEDVHVQAVEKLLNKEVETVTFGEERTGQAASDLQLQLAQTKYKLGMEYASHDKIDQALKELDGALLLDADNFTIRKQRWYLRYPEKFSPTIDFDWQKEQLEKDKKWEEEQRNKGLICGPDGCFISST